MAKITKTRISRAKDVVGKRIMADYSDGRRGAIGWIREREDGWMYCPIMTSEWKAVRNREAAINALVTIAERRD